MDSILISVAPVNAGDCHNDPIAIANDVIACYEAGASMVHLHCRDAHGALTPDLTHLEKTVQLIRQACPIVIEISTGGVSDLTIAQRCTPCTPDWVEFNSLNVGSVNLGNAVYQNPKAEVAVCVQEILAHQKVPEVEVFEVGMLHTTRLLADAFSIPQPLLMAIVLGHEGAMPATPWALDLMLQGLQHTFDGLDYVWGITQAHREDWALISAALDQGAKSVRIGFEDSNLLAPGVAAPSNAALVQRLQALLHEKGLTAATPQQVREKFRLLKK